MLAVLAIAVLWMGVYPKPFTDVMHVSVTEAAQARGHLQAVTEAASEHTHEPRMNWLAIAPEILLLVMACVVALVDLYVTDPRRRPPTCSTQASPARGACCTSRTGQIGGQTRVRCRACGRRPDGPPAGLLRHASR
jgi:hypothetical protein